MCVSRMGSLKPTLLSDTPTCHTWINKLANILYIITLLYMDAMMLIFRVQLTFRNLFHCCDWKCFFLTCQVRFSKVLCAGVLAMKSILDLLDLWNRLMSLCQSEHHKTCMTKQKKGID